MKKIIYLISGIVIISQMLACSMSNDDECELKNAEMYVLDHKDFYENYTREEWLQLPDSLKPSVYSSMTQRAKCSFWEHKISELKQLRWSQSELNHILDLENFIESNSMIFSKDYVDDSVNYAIVSSFASAWQRYAEQTLGWNQSIIYFVSASGDVLTDGLLNHFRNGGAHDLLDLAGGCPCSTESDWCSNSKKCVKSKCGRDVDGCGFLLLSECNGVCR